MKHFVDYRVVFLALAIMLGSIFLFSDHNPIQNNLLDIKFIDLNREEQKLSAWRGKIIVVNFWASWCEPCLREIPLLVDFQRQNSQKGVQVVGIGIDNDAKIREFADTYQINYPVFLGGARELELAHSLGNNLGALPFTIVLDRDGRLINSFLGEVTKTFLSDLLVKFPK